MERYSFLKYIKTKEKKLSKYKNLLESKISQLNLKQKGGDAIDLKQIQMELLKTKQKLKDIKNANQTQVINPYPELKGIIDSINLKINGLDADVKKFQKPEDIDKAEVINRVKEINILLDTTSADYTSATIDKNKISYVKEQIDTEVASNLFNKYINDTQSMVNKLKDQIQKGGLAAGETLVDNQEIQDNIAAIEEKIANYKSSISPILETEEKLNEYIKQMESLFTVKLITSFTPVKNDTKLYDKEFIQTVDEKNTKFSYYEDPKITEDGVEDEELVSTKFLNNPSPEQLVENAKKRKDDELDKIPKSQANSRRNSEDNPINNFTNKYFTITKKDQTDKKQMGGNNFEKQMGGTNFEVIPDENIKLLVTRKDLNNTMVELHQMWRKKMEKINEENKDIIKYKLLRTAVNSNISNLKTLMEDFNNIKTLKLKPELIEEVNLVLDSLRKKLFASEDVINVCNKLIMSFDINKKIDENLASKCETKIEFNNQEIKNLINKITVDVKENILTEKPSKEQQELNDKKKEINDIFKNFNNSDIAFGTTLLDSNYFKHLICLLKMSRNNDFNIVECNIIKKWPEINKGTDYRKLFFNASRATTKTGKAPELREKAIKLLEKCIELEKLLKSKNNLDEKPDLIKINGNLNALNKFNDEETKQFTKKYDNYRLGENIQIAENIQIGGKANFNSFIEKLNEFERVIREMKSKRKDVIKLIKHYNIRYTQFFNFQKYIVNYVSLVLAQKPYEMWLRVSKGTISFYDSILNKMEQIIDKYENPQFFTDKLLELDENKFLYGKHYFMIKILRKYFNELYQYWDEQFSNSNKEDPANIWFADNKLETQAESSNKKYFFLFNIFFKILDGYHMKLPPVANYMRINRIKGIPEGNDTFVKKAGFKNKLDIPNIVKCPGVKIDRIGDAIEKIDFEEIFDPDNFKENSSLSLYMGLSNMLMDRKSIMLLTYGYSGVGKTFTLFGAKAKGDAPSAPGLLQTTLNNLLQTKAIKLKAFELYGLGVPYKFYWEGDRFDHYIYNYTVDELNVSEPSIISDEGGGFANFLDKDKNYQVINKAQIDSFSTITSKIDDIRKANGRIKETINNPESSRSIMIYDFKIIFEEVPDKPSECRFVVMDLPGKENIYQTFCTDESENDKFRPRDEFIYHRRKPGVVKGDKVDYGTIDKSNKYDPKMIKSMMYMNPLWMALVPEIGEYFDETPNEKSDHLGAENKGAVNIRTYGTYKLNSNNQNSQPTFENLSKYQQRDKNFIKERYFTSFNTSFAHTQTGIAGAGGGPGKWDLIPEKYKEERLLNLGLYGMFDRSFSSILNMIKNENGRSDLMKLGKKINSMLKDEEARKLNYGFAGLEGIYINENILGLLQVLSEKIQLNRNKNLQPEDIKNVICPQVEIYKKLFKTKIPIDYQLLSKDAFENGEPVFVEEDEFYSQINFLKSLANLQLLADGPTFADVAEKSFFKATVSKRSKEGDNYNTDMRNLRKYKALDETTKGISDNIDDNKNNWINNYNYNKIFNIKRPAIKSILKPYLDDPSFGNFYLFFVVSNNLKVKGSTQIETCDKQIQLLYDTKDFMDIIAHENAEGVKNCDKN